MAFPSDNPVSEAVSEETGTSTDQLESAEDNTEVSTSAEETSSETETTTEQVVNQRLLAGRFRNAEELENSYQNLEREFSRRSNELHTLRQKAVAEQNPEAELNRFAEDLKRNPVEAIRNVTRAEVDQARAEAKQVRFESVYHQRKADPEFAQLEPVMTHLANEWQELIQANHLQNDPRILDILFLAAKGIKGGQSTQEAEARGKQKGELTALKKNKAQIEGSSGTKGNIKKNFEELSIDEMEKELIRQEKGQS